MCIPGGSTASSKTERQRLEEALERPSVREHEWCSDGKIIIEAARKHLATLPKRRVRMTRWMVAYNHSSQVDGTFKSREEAERYVLREQSHCIGNARYVELRGEYDE